MNSSQVSQRSRRHEIYLRDLVFVGRIVNTYHGYLPKRHPQLSDDGKIIDIGNPWPDGIRLASLDKNGTCHKFCGKRRRWVQLADKCMDILDLVSFPITRANHE